MRMCVSLRCWSGRGSGCPRGAAFTVVQREAGKCWGAASKPSLTILVSNTAWVDLAPLHQARLSLPPIQGFIENGQKTRDRDWGSGVSLSFVQTGKEKKINPSLGCFVNKWPAGTQAAPSAGFQPCHRASYSAGWDAFHWCFRKMHSVKGPQLKLWW